MDLKKYMEQLKLSGIKDKKVLFSAISQVIEALNAMH